MLQANVNQDDHSENEDDQSKKEIKINKDVEMGSMLD